MIVSADLEGLLTAALLHHHLAWKIAGFGSPQGLWLGDLALADKPVNVNLVSSAGSYSLVRGSRSTPHVCSPEGRLPDNIRQTAGPFPFSLPMFLLWLHDLPIRRELTARLLLLHAGDTWASVHHQPARTEAWLAQMSGYDWEWLFDQAATPLLEKRMQEKVEDPLERLLGTPSQGSWTGHYFNPDWDADVILNYFGFVGTWLKWSPPGIPDVQQKMGNELESGRAVTH